MNHIASIKLFYLEDDENAEEGNENLIGWINDEAGRIVAVPFVFTNLADARSSFDDRAGNGVGDYTHFLFDISVPFYKRLRDGEIVTYGATSGFAGLDFIVDYYTNNMLFREAMNDGRVGITSGHSIENFKANRDPNLSVVCNKVKYFPKLPNLSYEKPKQIRDWLIGKSQEDAS